MPAAARSQPQVARALPRSATPTAARGSLLFDASGKGLVDFHNAHGGVLLGHAFPPVERAAEEPGDPSTLRAELSERLCAMTHRADGLRLERDPATAYVYALDCAARATRRPGAVDALEALADPGALQTAGAVVLNPFADGMTPALARAARRVADGADAVLVLDERRSAFRCHHAGAEAMLGAQADLTVYGRSLANGRPLAAVCGPRHLLDPAQAMPEACADAALAAAVATLRLMDNEPVTTAIRIRGAEVSAELEVQIGLRGLDAAAAITGDPAWSRLVFTGDADGALQRLWRRTLYAHGVYSQGEQVMTYAHGDHEITALLDAAADALDEIARLPTATA